MDKISKTELPFIKSDPIDQLTIDSSINLILNEQAEAINAVFKNKKTLKNLINYLYLHFKKKHIGRLIFAGAGTSGRIAIQDGTELYPTFGWPKKRIGYLLAGGLKSLHTSIENAEDNVKLALKETEKLELNCNDVVFGLAASGNTPFTLEVLRVAKHYNCITVAISNNPEGKILKFGKFKIILDTEQEVIAGSTRMKAGTAQKVCLNLISSLLMVKLGFVRNGQMINLVAGNKKLRQRMSRINKIYN